MMRLAVVTSHPIQYQAPWFRELARRADLEVFFCHDQGAEGQADAGYGRAFTWDVPLLEGYRHSWLTNRSRKPGVFAFGGCDTPEIRDRLAAGRFDACIVNGWYLKSYIQAIFACRRVGLPVFLRGDSHRAADRPWATRALKYPLYRTLLTGVDGHLCVGESNRQYLRHYGVPAARLWFVPHCVDDQWFGRAAMHARSHGAVADVRQRLGVADEERIVLFVGRLVEQKRAGDFIAALARARHKRPLAGVIVGSGGLSDALADLSTRLDARVRFAGFANQSELPAFYAAAQMLVLPSDAGETWGLVANEALACGTPVVISDHAGCAADLVAPGTGRRFVCGSVEGLEEAMLALDAERQTAPQRVERAVAAMSARFGVAAAADAAIRALEQALGRTAHAAVAVGESVHP